MGRCRLRLDGQIERPKVELFLERPNEALGIRDMRLFLDPNAQASPIAPTASRGWGRSRPTATSCCPRAGGRRSTSPR